MNQARFMTNAEIERFAPDPPTGPVGARRRLRERLARYGVGDDRQLAGRLFPVACVALEVTQRCNLDCSLCYLSETAEAVRDIPLAELMRRLQTIHAQFGEHTNVQITGGDPTLRDADDLEAVVREIRRLKMRSALFTNGIRAQRSSLTRLATAGLDDVAFHVDMTQGRRGYANEAELNALRDSYIARASGLGLRIMFNTTVFDGNLRDTAMLARFFVTRADRVHLASFQMQADTGRGILRGRDDAVLTADAVAREIEHGAGCDVFRGAPLIGHPDCSRYGALYVSGGAECPVFEDGRVLKILAARARGITDWNGAKPRVRDLLHVLVHLRRVAWLLRRGLPRGRFRISRLNFVIHNFMDAGRLERPRCETCVFKVATADGPLSMCVHNAKRDAYVTRPIVLDTDGARAIWDPMLGAGLRHSAKQRKGRAAQSPSGPLSRQSYS